MKAVNHKMKQGNVLGNILESIGNTPMLDLGDGIYAKAEFVNPSGSIKARMARPPAIT